MTMSCDCIEYKKACDGSRASSQDHVLCSQDHVLGYRSWTWVANPSSSQMLAAPAAVLVKDAGVRLICAGWAAVCSLALLLPFRFLPWRSTSMKPLSLWTMGVGGKAGSIMVPFGFPCFSWRVAGEGVFGGLWRCTGQATGGGIVALSSASSLVL